MQSLSFQESEAQVLRDRTAAILWIRTQMVRYGVHLSDLENAGCFRPETSTSKRSTGVIRFRDASGHVWNGEGEMPEWLLRAVNAGQSIDHFRTDI